jgi:fatty-acyl-CoA synthase
LKDGEELTAEEVKDTADLIWQSINTPRYVDFVTEFPMNAAGKIMKYKMREHAVDKLKLREKG